MLANLVWTSFEDKHYAISLFKQCGGCWAFSVVGAVESAYAIKGKPLEDLSVQQVIDCSYNNYGCNGGSTLNALNWLNKVISRPFELFVSAFVYLRCI